MPIISMFFGIVIRMHYREHEPAHFHAEFHNASSKFDFEGTMIVGNIRSRTALGLIRNCAVAHRGALETNWRKMKEGRPLDRIEPLE